MAYENAAIIIEAMTAGIRERFTQVKLDSATWEAIARTALEPRIFGGAERFFAEQIEKLFLVLRVWEHAPPAAA